MPKFGTFDPILEVTSDDNDDVVEFLLQLSPIAPITRFSQSPNLSQLPHLLQLPPFTPIIPTTPITPYTLAGDLSTGHAHL